MIGTTQAAGHRWPHQVVELLTSCLEGWADVEWIGSLEPALDWWEADVSTLPMGVSGVSAGDRPKAGWHR